MSKAFRRDKVSAETDIFIQGNAGFSFMEMKNEITVKEIIYLNRLNFAYGIRIPVILCSGV